MPNLVSMGGQALFSNSSLSGIDSISLQELKLPPIGSMYSDLFFSMTNLKYVYLPNTAKGAGPINPDFRYMFQYSNNIEYIVWPKWDLAFNDLTSTKLKFIDRNNYYSFNLGENNVLRDYVIRKTNGVSSLTNAYASYTNPLGGYPDGSCLNVYVARDLIDSYKTATNWSACYELGRVDFKALEDYTVDGTVTGGFDYDKIGLEVYHNVN